MLVSLFGEIQVFLLLSIIFVGFLYWINRKYKSFNKQIIKAIDIPVYLISKQGIVLKLLNEPTEKTNLLPLNNLGKLDLRNLVIDAKEYQKHIALLQKARLNARKTKNTAIFWRAYSKTFLLLLL